MRLGRSLKRADGVFVASWYHPRCLPDVSKKATTWAVTDARQFAGFDALRPADQAALEGLVRRYAVISHAPAGGHRKGALGDSSGGGQAPRQATLFAFLGGGGKPALPARGGAPAAVAAASSTSASAASEGGVDDGAPPPDAFIRWCDTMEAVAATAAQSAKQATVRRYLAGLAAADEGDGAQAAASLPARRAALGTALMLALPKEDKRVYRLADRTLARVLPEVLNSDVAAFAEDVKACGEVGDAAARLWERVRRDGGGGDRARPWLTLAQVDAFLDSLTRLSRDAEQRDAVAGAVHRCCSGAELKWLVRLVKKELRVGAQAAQLIPCLCASPARGQAALDDYRASAQLEAVVDKYGGDLLAAAAAAGGGSSASGSDGSSAAAAAGNGREPPSSRSQRKRTAATAATAAAAAPPDDDGAGGHSSPPASPPRKRAAVAAAGAAAADSEEASTSSRPRAAAMASPAAAAPGGSSDEAIDAVRRAILADKAAGLMDEDDVGGNRGAGDEKEEEALLAAEAVAEAPRKGMPRRAHARAAAADAARDADDGGDADDDTGSAAGGENDAAEGAAASSSSSSAAAALRMRPGVPLKPMLAEAVGSIDAAWARCTGRVVAEVKYDGNRVQVHKQGASFQYFSRSLKPMKPDQVEHIAALMPHALPGGDSAILDGEVLLVAPDGAMLAFGSLGSEERKKYAGAHPALFVFDILYLNGKVRGQWQRRGAWGCGLSLPAGVVGPSAADTRRLTTLSPHRHS